MTNTPTAAPAASAPEATDPSMEEILASIRRILNEDDEPPPGEPAARAEDEVLVLEESMLVQPDEPLVEVEDATPARDSASHDTFAPDAFAPPAASQDLASIPFMKMEAPTPTPHPAATEPPDSGPDLVAPEVAAAAAFSVGSLVRTLAAGRATQVYSGGPTLEDIVRSELRPLMKEWLDANLPPMVERLVRAEIEKVVGRGLG